MPDGTQSGTSAISNDLPAWYKQYTQNLASGAQALATGLNAAPLPAQSVAGFNPTQTRAFDAILANQGNWQSDLQAARDLSDKVLPTVTNFIGSAQSAAATPTMMAGDAIKPWAQSAKDAASGSALTWDENYKKYINPYTSEVVDNIARLGKRNWEDSIMPGVNSSMIGAGQFGSTRNADILTKAGLSANQDILGQQSNALMSGYTTGANIFNADAGRTQNQQQMQVNAALGSGNMMQGALSSDANRVQAQSQLQANVALGGANTSLSALKAAMDSAGALTQLRQALGQNDVNTLLASGAQQQALQQKGLDAAFTNAQIARTDPWTQITNQQGVLNNIKLPTLQSTAQTGQVGQPPTSTDSLAAALATLAGVLK